MNRVKDADDRYEYGKSIERYINLELEGGHNPFKTINTKSFGTPEIAKQLELIVKENTRHASAYKINSYNEQSNRFIKYLECEGL